jgi:hypothetical protein
VYLLGGYTTVATATVYTAPINPDGTLGAWAVGTSLPGTFGYSQTIVTNTKVYIFAGFTSAAVSTVYVASFTGGVNDYTNLSYTQEELANGFFIPDFRPADMLIPGEAARYYIKY